MSETREDHDYTGDPKHCHQCALKAFAKEWKRADAAMTERDALASQVATLTAEVERLKVGQATAIRALDTASAEVERLTQERDAALADVRRMAQATVGTCYQHTPQTVTVQAFLDSLLACPECWRQCAISEEARAKAAEARVTALEAAAALAPRDDVPSGHSMACMMLQEDLCICGRAALTPPKDPA